MTAIEKMAKALERAYPIASDSWEPEAKAALRALIDHIKETGEEEMVEAFWKAYHTANKRQKESVCNGIRDGLIAALEEVVK